MALGFGGEGEAKEGEAKEEEEQRQEEEVTRNSIQCMVRVAMLVPHYSPASCLTLLYGSTTTHIFCHAYHNFSHDDTSLLTAVRHELVI